MTTAYAMPKRNRWALMLLKFNATEPLKEALSGVDHATFRCWAWIFIVGMSDLPTVGATSPSGVSGKHLLVN